MISTKLVKQLEKTLKQMPIVWDGREAILEMRDAGYSHWKQMEWVGFYFQFLCESKLSPIVKIPGPKYGNVEFDGFSEIPWDFKAHPRKNAKGKINTSVIINDRQAIVEAIKQHSSVGLILAIGDAEFNDENRNFQIWHKKLKGKMSDYEKKRILRKAPSRLRKTSFKLKEVVLILIDKKVIKKLNSFQEGFRNSDGSPRHAKILLNLDNIVSIKTIRPE
ncbi:hypothetical protein KJ756_01905 [Patescibacteria group bacterium]|nr:hypothetical protein [Patescibacteria group bacterium]MBU4082445.1 hypothetical protein [Patescibacteria group bacterium]